jgi:ABC-type nitrate/sulfonate/bicarbonate transport system substrate-binding protein
MSGEVAISQGGVTGAINSNLKGAGTYIILGGADRFPYQLVVSAGIKQVSELKGKRFAVSRIGSADHTATLFCFTEARYPTRPRDEHRPGRLGAEPLGCAD